MRLTALLITSLFFLPAVAAHGEPPAEMSALGDIDGDGHGDMLSLQNGTATALLGPFLTEAAWSVDDVVWSGGVGLDLDGDGLGDPVFGSFDWRDDGLGDRVGPVWLGTTDYGYADAYRHVSATDGSVITEAGYHYDSTGTGASGSAVLAFAAAEAGKESYTASFPVSPDQVVAISQVEDGALIFAYAVTFIYERVGVDSMVLASQDLAGSTYATVTLDDPEFAVTGIGMADLDQDGYLDFLTLETLEVPLLGALPAGPAQERMSAWSGRDGSTLWQHTTELGVGSSSRYMEMYPIGDLDGDGWQDVFAQDWSSDEAQLLSGADGSVLKAIPEAWDLFALPWGDSDGDGHEEYLEVGFDWESDGMHFAVKGLGGEQWSQSIDSYADPMNLDIHPSGMSARLTDWTGDDIPDLALVLWEEDSSIMLIDGSDGSIRYEREMRAAMDFMAVDDVTGDGLSDLVLIKLTDEDGDPANGDRSATAIVEAYRGSDMQQAWSRVLVDGDVELDLSDAWLSGAQASDLDGDGIADIWVRLQSGYHDDCCYYYIDDVEMSSPYEDEGDGEDFAIAWIISGRDATTLWKDEREWDASLPDVPAELGAAALQEVVDSEAPGIPLVALLVGIVVVVGLRRR